MIRPQDTFSRQSWAPGKANGVFPQQPVFLQHIQGNGGFQQSPELLVLTIAWLAPSYILH